jgi:hypothetical protein
VSVPHARGFLLLRRGGGLWGIANAAVDGLARRGEGFCIAVHGDGGELVADEVVGVVEDLPVRPVAPLVRRFWPEPLAGLAVHGRLPVVVVDPAHLPAILRPAPQEGDRRDEGSE